MIEYHLVLNVFVMSREEWKSSIIWGTSGLDTEFTQTTKQVNTCRSSVAPFDASEVAGR